jgi:hypothetical protein
MLQKDRPRGRRGELFTEQVLPRRDDGMLGHKHHAASHPVQRNLGSVGPSSGNASTAVAMAMHMEWIMVPRCNDTFNEVSTVTESRVPVHGRGNARASPTISIHSI